MNFETTLADGSCKPIIKRGPNLKCTEVAIKALKYVGFDSVTLANNHFEITEMKVAACHLKHWNAIV